MVKITYDSLQDIYIAVRNQIRENLANHESLQEINKIIYGERVRIGNLDKPTIWILPFSWQPNLEGGSRTIHDITFDFVTLVKSYDTEEGLEKAQILSMAVYDALMQDKTLNGLVHQVLPLQVDPAYEIGDSTQVYYSRVQFAFRLQRRE